MGAPTGSSTTTLFLDGALSSPSLWIYFAKGTVSTVQRKRHGVISADEAVYEARADRRTFESPDFEPTFNLAR